MLNGYLTVFEAKTGKRLGRASLKRVLTGEAPGLSRHCRIGSHLGLPVLRIEERFASDFRDSYQTVRRVLADIGYRCKPELTKRAQDAVWPNL